MYINSFIQMSAFRSSETRTLGDTAAKCLTSQPQPQCAALYSNKYLTAQLKFVSFAVLVYQHSSFRFRCCPQLIDETILCVHGGLSPEIRTLDQVRTIERAQEIPHKGPFCDLMWSDPEEVDTWAISPRGAGWLFGNKVTNEVLVYPPAPTFLEFTSLQTFSIGLCDGCLLYQSNHTVLQNTSIMYCALVRAYEQPQARVPRTSAGQRGCVCLIYCYRNS